jgi:hypothetical protein
MTVTLEPEIVIVVFHQTCVKLFLLLLACSLLGLTDYLEHGTNVEVLLVLRDVANQRVVLAIQIFEIVILTFPRVRIVLNGILKEVSIFLLSTHQV